MLIVIFIYCSDNGSVSGGSTRRTDYSNSANEEEMQPLTFTAQKPTIVSRLK